MLTPTADRTILLGESHCISFFYKGCFFRTVQIPSRKQCRSHSLLLLSLEGRVIYSIFSLLSQDLTTMSHPTEAFHPVSLSARRTPL